MFLWLEKDMSKFCIQERDTLKRLKQKECKYSLSILFVLIIINMLCSGQLVYTLINFNGF